MNKKPSHHILFFAKQFYIIFILALILSTVTSCSIFRGGRKSDKQVQKEMVKRQNKAIDEEVEKYDKKYKEQTNRQAKEQRKKIKKSRRKPKHMGNYERKFFLWRWLGI